MELHPDAPAPFRESKAHADFGYGLHGLRLAGWVLGPRPARVLCRLAEHPPRLLAEARSDLPSAALAAARPDLPPAEHRRGFALPVLLLGCPREGALLVEVELEDETRVPLFRLPFVRRAPPLVARKLPTPVLLTGTDHDALRDMRAALTSHPAIASVPVDIPLLRTWLERLHFLTQPRRRTREPDLFDGAPVAPGQLAGGNPFAPVLGREPALEAWFAGEYPALLADLVGEVVDGSLRAFGPPGATHLVEDFLLPEDLRALGWARELAPAAREISVVRTPGRDPPRSDVLVIAAEELRETPRRVLARAGAFLGMVPDRGFP